MITKQRNNAFSNIKIEKVNLPTNLLVNKYVVPPFSLLDTRAGYWQERARMWKRLGIKSELGRGDNLTYGIGCFNYNDEKERQAVKKNNSTKFGKCLPDDSISDKYGRKVQETSIFDPVLTEIMYRWFSREGDKIIDPFAGGSVRGVVAACLGRNYVGMDLSGVQVEANRVQFENIKKNYCDVKGTARWIEGDSLTFKDVAPDKYNMLMTCPPYYDLEVYSDKPEDISNKDSYEDFLKAYEEIIKRACDMLEEDSFAVCVVGEVRDKKTGFYRGFVPDTIKAFEKAGLHYYNEAILVNVAGTLPVRIGNQFNAGRKLGKQHQNVIICYKGDPKNIKTKFGVIEANE